MISQDLYPPPHRSWKQVAAKLSPDAQERLMQGFKDIEAENLSLDFALNARREQLPPPGFWNIWVILAGRGFGKNFAGSNWLIDGHLTGKMQNTGIVAATSADLRRYCVEGSSGILAQAPAYFKPRDVPSKSRLEWPNGTYTHYFTAEKPNRLRGPNLDGAWCDELSWWSKMEETWDMLSFALRLGAHPQRIITMTPRPNRLVKELIKREGKDTVVTRGATYDNVGNLSATYVAELREKYEGTRLGRQEIGGELLTDADGALWNYTMLDGLRNPDPAEDLTRVVIGLDPSTTSGEKSDEAGIVAAGRDSHKQGHVLADYSLRGTPLEWAKKSIWAYHHHEANAIVAEVNQGGDMVETIIKGLDRNVVVKKVRASKGKTARAEPVSALYEQGRVSHHGTFAQLEDEMCDFVPDDLLESPNRVDALVWAMTDLVANVRQNRGTWGRKGEAERGKKRSTWGREFKTVRQRTYKVKAYG